MTMENSKELIDTPEDLDEWLNMLSNKGGKLEKLAENFKYMKNNMEDFENGELEPEDLPNFEKFDNTIIIQSVCFGTSIQPILNNLYEVTNDSGFVGATMSEENAYNMLGTNQVGNIRTINIETSFNPYEFIEKTKEHGLSQYADSLELCYNWIRENNIKSLDKDFQDFSDENNLDYIVAYSVIFGMIWEREVPSVYIVYNSEGIHRASTSKPEDTPKSESEFYVKHLREEIET